ncbi:MAG: right-handed parallel beta-helix repeat-containing protein [Thermoanaerobaculia bacterium]
MKRTSVHALLSFLVLLTLSAAAQAQATRTWVSGVGDDANPCSRTAPCKTFAGAISKTAAGGEINVLDPGGFGGVTITKSITISSEGFEAGVLVSGTNAIIINAANTDRIILRGLDIEGLGTGLAGIKVLSAGAVDVENCTIHHFTQWGIDFVPTSATTVTSQLHVNDTIIRNNLGASSGGIRIKPGTNVSAVGVVENTRLNNNFQGLRVEDNSKVTAKDSSAIGNTTASGFIAVSNATGVTLNLFSCVSTGNLNGVKSDNPNATVRVSDCMIAGNGTGLATSGGGHIVTFGDVMNADTGAPTDADIPKQ